MTNEKRVLICFVLFIFDLFLYQVLLAQTAPDEPFDGRLTIREVEYFYRADTTTARIGDTLKVEWEAPAEFDLAGYHLRYIGAATEQSTWFPLEGITTGGVLWSAPLRLVVPPGLYLVGIEAQDAAGNKSGLSVAVWLRVESTLLRRPRMVRITLI